MTDALTVPDSLAATLDDDILAALYDALGPPAEQRLAATFEIEVEAAGEGTFTLRYADGALTGKKGFARGDPFISVEVPRRGWGLVQRLLQDAADGFPQAPVLRRRQDAARGLTQAELQAVFDGLGKLKDCAVSIDVGGVGTFRLGRGALDEATRELTVKLDGDAVDAALERGELDALRSSKLAGDKRLQGDVLAALGGAWLKVRAA